MRVRLTAAAASAAIFIASCAQAALTHLYTFNDGTADDSVGNANGTLVNGAFVSNGQLRFAVGINGGANNPTIGQYVSLPSNILKSSSFTVEAWATTFSTARWQRIIDVGNAGGQGFTILTPFNNLDEVLGQVSIATAGGLGDTNYVAGRPLGSTSIAINREYYYAFVHDRVAGLESLYVNGTLVGSAPATVDPATTNYSNFYIGRSNFAADPYWVGTYNELRTYDTPLTAAQVAANYAAGVTLVPEPASGTASVLLGARLFARGRRKQAV